MLSDRLLLARGSALAGGLKRFWPALNLLFPPIVPPERREAWLGAARRVAVREIQGYRTFVPGHPDYTDITDTLVLECPALEAHVSQAGAGEWVD